MICVLLFFVFFELLFFFDFFFRILGPGTMLLRSGPGFCEERRIRYVRCSYLDPVQEELVFKKITMTSCLNCPDVILRAHFSDGFVAVSSSFLRCFAVMATFFHFLASREVQGPDPSGHQKNN